MRGAMLLAGFLAACAGDVVQDHPVPTSVWVNGTAAAGPAEGPDVRHAPAGRKVGFCLVEVASRRSMSLYFKQRVPGGFILSRPSGVEVSKLRTFKPTGVVERRGDTEWLEFRLVR